MFRERRLGLFRQVLVLACFLTATPAAAAKQGALGPTSTGSVRISVSTAPQATVTGARDMSLGQSGTGGDHVTQTLCLSGNSPSRAYSIVATGGGEAGAFELTSGDRVIGYTIEWIGPPAMPPGDDAASTTLLEAAFRQPACNLGPSSRALVIAIGEEDADEVRTSGTFTGVLTLMVSPG